jgi:hypothetical protein
MSTSTTNSGVDWRPGGGTLTLKKNEDTEKLNLIFFFHFISKKIYFRKILGDNKKKKRASMV